MSSSDKFAFALFFINSRCVQEITKSNNLRADKIEDVASLAPSSFHVLGLQLVACRGRHHPAQNLNLVNKIFGDRQTDRVLLDTKENIKVNYIRS